MNNTQELIAFVESKEFLRNLANWKNAIIENKVVENVVRAIRDNWPKEMEWTSPSIKPEMGRRIAALYSDGVSESFPWIMDRFPDSVIRWCYLPADPKPQPTDAEKAWEEQKETLDLRLTIEEIRFAKENFMVGWQKARESKLSSSS